MAGFTERYTLLRTELVELYKIFTERTFIVIIPMASFFTLEQLEKYREHPPMGGFESLSEPVERPFTVVKLLQAISVMGDEITLGWRYPRQDVPVVYDAIQKWIQHWIEIKSNWGYLRSPDIGELELIEKLGRLLFEPYAHYYHERVNKDMHVDINKELTLIDILRGQMIHGKDYGQPISYISHLDQYKSETGYSGSFNNTGGTLDFLRGFGGGM